MVMAPSESPEIKYPTAAPGRIAHAIASPVKLIRRSIRKTPTGVAPMEMAIQPSKARRMKPNSANGAKKISQIILGADRTHVADRHKLRTFAGPEIGFQT